MTTTFWEHQQEAKKKTRIYLVIFALMTLGTAASIELIVRAADPADYDTPIPFLGLLFTGVTLAVAFFKYSLFTRYGGSYVAESVGAHLAESPRDFQQQQLLNIVEEMAIAASIPPPPVYVIDAKEINAFAAGTSPENAAIAVTRGALEKLNREELQGVIAHEMGHIVNGDMSLNMRLAAMVMGFFFILYITFRVVQFAPWGRRRRDDNGKGGAFIVVVAMAMFVAGLLTWFLGSILKACVSRQREYLADASAVQFTRNNLGIAGALQKIAKDGVSDMPAEGMAFSHMYFDNHLGWNALFATHPPLEKRIEKLLGDTGDIQDK